MSNARADRLQRFLDLLDRWRRMVPGRSWDYEIEPEAMFVYLFQRLMFPILETNPAVYVETMLRYSFHITDEQSETNFIRFIEQEMQAQLDSRKEEQTAKPAESRLNKLGGITWKN